MEIKYIWSAKSKDPNEVTSVTMNSDFVPRIGETVDIYVQVAKKEHVEKGGRVKDVMWYIRNKNSYVCVFI